MSSSNLVWPPGNGAMAQHIRQYDWAATSLGAIEQWPERFRALVELMLDSPEMTSILWGRNAIQLYNDAYAQGMRARHPGALGRPVATTWSDAWATFAPLIERAWAGESVKQPNVPLVFDSEDPDAERCFDLSYTPVRDESGEIGGVYSVVVETTGHASAEQTLRSSEERFRTLFEAIDAGYALYEPIYDDQGSMTDVKILEVNPAYERLTHRTAPSGKTLNQVSPGLDPLWADAMSHVIESGQPARFERHNLGIDRWFDVFISLVDAGAHPRIVLILNDITERKRAIDALQQSEERYRVLFESIDQGFCTIEVFFDDAGTPVDYQFLDINPAFERTSGLENAIGKRMRELAPLHEDYWFQIYGEVARTLQPARFEAEAAALGRWYNIYAYPIGQPANHRVAVLFEDITERRRAFAAMHESESRFRTLIQNLPDYAIFLLDPGGRITEWSEGAEHITGFTSEEALGQHVAMLYPAEAIADGEPEQELARAASLGRVERESWLLRKDGEPYWGNEIVTAIRDEFGAIRGFTKIIRDLTERRHAEEALRASEERARAIVEEATDYAIFTIDPEMMIEDWFPGAEAVFGWSAEEAIGMPFASTFTPPDRAADIPAQEFNQARLHGTAPDIRWHLHKSGSAVFIEGAVRARFDLDGEFLGVLKIGRDATQERLAEQERSKQEERSRRELRLQVAAATRQLRTLSRRLLMVQEEERRFLARELHDEIGQMLTGLSLTLSTMSAKDGQVREAQRIVAELTHQVRQLSMDLRPAALDAYGLAPALRGHIERYEVRTGIMVDLRVEGLDRRFAAPVESTAYRIVQEALTNLARHANVADAVVQLFADEQMLTVSIRDSGCGFDPATVHEGSGLGGMRERAELLGGTFVIDTAPGAGVRLTAELPLTNPLPERPSAPDLHEDVL